MPDLRKITSVALMVKDGNQPAKVVSRDIVRWLRARGIATRDCGRRGEEFSSVRPEEELILVLGGDGTIVSMARRILGSGVPLAGINFGQVGFLADLSATNWERKLEEILEKGLSVETRMSLRYDLFRNGARIRSGEVINDAVVTRGKVARLINLVLRVKDAPLISLRADGLIFSTPTGSSAYACSAGGPLLMPGLNAYAVVAICPYLTSFPPLVLSAETVFSVMVGDSLSELYLTLDGHEAHLLAEGDRLDVWGMPERFFMADFGMKNYFERLREAGFVQTIKRQD
ncbi:MAG: NAD(+)/NADH kinase [Desulfovibrio sp.]|jgi:NAD+ kinase|nr:NAD(+)/NADH kinase [Desulfovibrio sp.]